MDLSQDMVAVAHTEATRGRGSTTEEITLFAPFHWDPTPS